MRVLVAMSGGVDSSVAAALLLRQGHEVAGATMKLWGGPSDTGCCSVADVEDARRVCQQLGVDHHVFNFTADFERHVVGPYVAAHGRGLTPNPCVACNAHLKFDRFLERALQVGFDAIATGHHARVAAWGGQWWLLRGADPQKDQSYVLYMLGQEQLSRLLLPIGELTKPQVRSVAMELGLRTAHKADSQDVCFVPRAAGREGFLRSRMELHPGELVSTGGEKLGSVEALELLTIGQRRRLGPAGGSPQRKYVLEVDIARRRATLGTNEDLLVGSVGLRDVRWVLGPPEDGAAVMAQLSAHGQPLAARWLPAPSGPAEAAATTGLGAGGPIEGVVAFVGAARRPAPGQAVVLYRSSAQGEVVLGGGTAA